eukprot:752240-Hanusia_phi.AAC.5
MLCIHVFKYLVYSCNQRWSLITAAISRVFVCSNISCIRVLNAGVYLLPISMWTTSFSTVRMSACIASSSTRAAHACNPSSADPPTGRAPPLSPPRPSAAPPGSAAPCSVQAPAAAFFCTPAMRGPQAGRDVLGPGPGGTRAWSVWTERKTYREEAGDRRVGADEVSESEGESEMGWSWEEGERRERERKEGGRGPGQMGRWEGGEGEVEGDDGSKEVLLRSCRGGAQTMVALGLLVAKLHFEG